MYTFTVSAFHKGHQRTQGGFKGGNFEQDYSHEVEEIARANAERAAKYLVEIHDYEYARVSAKPLA